MKTIKNHGQPIDIESLHGMLTFESPSQIRGLASLSKKLANLKDVWGLAKWPTVNPKNIRDKIYVILAGNGKPMHFSDISKAIKESDFKRRNVTTQAIHNELIKDKRFVLIGRGIYALDSWGYSKGTVSDIIADILRKAGSRFTATKLLGACSRAAKSKKQLFCSICKANRCSSASPKRLTPSPNHSNNLSADSA